MAARQYYYAESLGRVTTTQTTDQGKVSLVFTPDASSDYWLIWHALADMASVNSAQYGLYKLTETAGSTLLNQNQLMPLSDPTVTVLPAGGVARHQEGASPVERTFALTYATTTATIAAGIQSATVAALKADAADEFAISDGESTTTEITAQDKLELAFTPASSGDYLIIASGELTALIVGNRAIAHLFDGTTVYGERAATAIWYSASGYSLWTTMVKATLSGAQSWKVRFYNISASGTPTARIRRVRILAIRLDTLEAASYAESRTESTTGGTTYLDKATLTYTPPAVPHLLLACGLHSTSQSAVNEEAYMRLIEDATPSEPEIYNNNNNQSAQFLPSYVFTPAAAETTWKIQYKHGSGGVRLTRIGETAIALLQLDVSTLTETLVPTSDVGTPTNATGTWDNVNEGVDAASDGTFIAPTDTSLAMVKRLAYPALTAGRTLVTGAGLQKVRVKAWKTPGVNATTLTVTIKEAGGAVLATPINAVSVTNEAGQIIEGTFDATVIADNTAADIETEITTAPGAP